LAAGSITYAEPACPRFDMRGNLGRASPHTRLISAAIAAMLLFVATPAVAQRPDVRAMSCPEAQALVARRGAVLMTTGQYTYERFVAARGFCMREEQILPGWANTGDGVRCRVAYRCGFSNRIIDD
jgi:hypothetical protein